MKIIGNMPMVSRNAEFGRPADRFPVCSTRRIWQYNQCNMFKYSYNKLWIDVENVGEKN